jgi:O-antigen/teichoic acid export membrane protein
MTDWSMELKRTGLRTSVLAGLKEVGAAVFGVTTRKFSSALVDQIVVSGANLITTILIGRCCGPEELANYALAFTLVILTFSVLETLIVMPYTIFVQRLDGTARLEYRGAVLVQCGGLAALAALAIAGWGLVLSTGLGPAGLGPMLFTLSAAIPFYLLREWVRKFLFAHLHSNQALQLDLTAATLQILALFLLTAGGLLSAVTATLVIGAANALVALPWLIRSRSEWLLRRNQIWPALRRNWSFGRWLFAGRIVGQMNSDLLLLWLMAFVIGKKATGIFAACMTVISLSNPFILGIGQVLTPWLAQALTDGGPGELRRVTRKATGLMGLALGGFCLGLWLWGEEALRLLYGGQYMGQGPLVFLLSVSILAFALSLPPMGSLLVLGRPDMSLKVSVVGLLLTAAVAFVLVGSWGLVGVACGLIVGQTGSSAMRWIVFNRLSLNQTPPGDRSAGPTGVET